MNDSKIKAHCNACSSETNHEVLQTANREWVDYDEDGHVMHHESATYRMVQCLGCEEIKLQVVSKGPWPDSPPEYYPPALFRRRPMWMSDMLLNSFGGGIHKTLFDLLTEVYKSLQNGMPRLATMGIRATLEAIMLDKVGDQGTFTNNVSALAKSGQISTVQAARISSVLDAGSAVIHRGHQPNNEDVIAMVNLIENLVESIYFHQAPLDALSKRVPPRDPRKSF